jgi:hypothetical protein
MAATSFLRVLGLRSATRGRPPGGESRESCASEIFRRSPSGRNSPRLSRSQSPNAGRAPDHYCDGESYSKHRAFPSRRRKQSLEPSALLEKTSRRPPKCRLIIRLIIGNGNHLDEFRLYRNLGLVTKIGVEKPGILLNHDIFSLLISKKLIEN